jgi:uncharacterized protein YndB with AHSA1/START domain
MNQLSTFLATLLLMTSTLRAQSGLASTEKTTFSRTTSVSIVIRASSQIVWQLLTQAADYPRWNSTIISIDGTIAPGKKIRLKARLDPKRTFTLKVKEFEPEKKLVWGDGQGSRVYSLLQQTDGGVLFSMIEKIGGLMFPLYAKMIPSFDASFTQFAADLKKEAELIMQAK